ncbi:hypothetical protein [Pedobacter antarcticus]|uniref:hypothetical protein n=1 Tax=Pedobacter antarcticus TaxID=34086 RepID=UPI002930CA38|nr:hypothetical protein [Pedobacter antarcticus]
MAKTNDSKPNGYALSRAWFDFAFENHKCNVYHTSIFMWIIELNNRLGWKNQFGLPTADTMEGLSIGNRNTYNLALYDIEIWGFIKIIQRAKNQYQSCIIEICHSRSEQALHQALDQALIGHSINHCSGTASSIASDIDTIDKPINKETIKPQTKKQYSDTKVSGDDKKLYDKFKLFFLEFYKTNFNSGEYYFQAKDGKKLKDLIKKISFKVQEKCKAENENFTNDLIAPAFEFFIQKSFEVGDAWLKQNFDLSTIDSKFNDLFIQIKNGRNLGKPKRGFDILQGFDDVKMNDDLK